MQESQHDEKSIIKNHARWESEHGHWTKDLKHWLTQHQNARSILFGLGQALEHFDEQVDQHSEHIKNHHEIVKLHEDALAWQKHEGKTGGKQVDHHSAVHKSESMAHESEQQVHQQLGILHDNVRECVIQLAKAFNVPLYPQ